MERKLRIYTVAEANALLPELSAGLAAQFQHLRAVELLVQQLRVAIGPRAPVDLREDPNDPSDVVELKSRLRRRIGELRAAADRIEATGAIVKDLRGGLVDFCCRRGRLLVWLCWRYGEASVRFWHPQDECVGARRPLGEPSAERDLN